MSSMHVRFSFCVQFVAFIRVGGQGIHLHAFFFSLYFQGVNTHTLDILWLVNRFYSFYREHDRQGGMPSTTIKSMQTTNTKKPQYVDDSN